MMNAKAILFAGAAGLVALAAAGAARAQSAQTAPITTVQDLLAAGYNTYVEDNMGAPGAAYSSDSQGAIAVGGNANLTGFGASTNATANGVGLAVGGNLTMTNGSVNGTTSVAGNVTASSTGFGNVVAGGNLSYSNGQIGGSVAVGGNAVISGAGVSGSIAAGGSVAYNGSTPSVAAPASYAAPINFAATSANLQAVSTTLAGMSATAGDSLSQSGGGYTFNASSAGTNVFNITGSQLASMGSSQVTFSATQSGATEVINILSTGNVVLPSNLSFDYSGAITDTKVLFNIPNASTVTMGTGASYDFSIMAPNATLVTNSNGNLTGSVFVQNLTGGAQLNLSNSGGTFSGALPKSIAPAPMPLPGSSPLALLLIGWFRRKHIRRWAHAVLNRCAAPAYAV